MDLCVSGQDISVGCCEHCNEHSGLINAENSVVTWGTVIRQDLTVSQLIFSG